MRDLVDLFREAIQTTGKTLRLCLLLLFFGVTAFGIIQLLQFVRLVRLA